VLIAFYLMLMRYLWAFQRVGSACHRDV